MKQLKFEDNARQSILRGIETLAKAVTSSLGPRGRNTLYKHKTGVIFSTRDGVTIAKQVQLQDKFEDMGAQVVKSAAEKQVNICGDGTTTTVSLAHSIYSEGLRMIASGFNPIEIKRGIDKAKEAVSEYLQAISKPIKSSEEIAQVGFISANSDKEVGDLIAQAMGAIGNNGIISLEEGSGFKTELKIVNGYMFDKGYLSPHFVNNEKMECVLRDCLILLTDNIINNIAVIVPFLENMIKTYPGKPLLIIADDITGDALPTLVVNKLKGNISCCCCKSPAFGDRRKEVMQDLAILTGAKYVSADTGLKLESADPGVLGMAKKVIVTSNSTTIIEGQGNVAAIEERVAQIRAGMKQMDNEWDKSKQEERLAKLVGGVAVISVGGATEISMKEKKDRVEDALAACKASVQEGIVPGGGVALLRAIKSLDGLKLTDEQQPGVNIIKKSLEAPIRKIVENAGEKPDVIVDQVLKSDNINYGYNAQTNKFEDLVIAGVIDPTKVVRVALENAVSVAGLLLTTECMITDLPDETNDNKNKK